MTETAWENVQPGDTIIGADKQKWLVSECYPDGEVLLTRESDQKTHRGKPSGRVQITSTRQLEMAMAGGLVAVKLGGIEIYKQVGDRTSEKLVPVDFIDPGTLLAHLFIFHGYRSDTPDLAGLRAEHAARHDPEVKEMQEYEPHRHDPDFDST